MMNKTILVVFLMLLIACKGEKREKQSLDKQNVTQLLHDPEAFDDFNTLPLIPSETSTVYHAIEGDWQFNLHSYLIRHDDKFWAMWSSGPINESDRDQVIHYATSTDGHHWDPPGMITNSPIASDGKAGIVVARGFYELDGKFIALVATMDSIIGVGPEVYKRAWANLKLLRFEWDGGKWIDRGVFLDDFMSNYPPRPIKDRLFMTRRDGASRKVYTALSNTLEGEVWTSTLLQEEPPVARMSEPTWYIGPDEVVHLIFRDKQREGYLYHSISLDDGFTFSIPLKTNYPDTPAKSYTGRLSSGEYYLINNPGKTRDPLAVTFSRDGWTFSNAALLRHNAPELRYPGSAKSSRTFQYPHAIEYKGSLWLIYATNKEDIEISEFKLSELQKAAEQNTDHNIN
jgi:hypothetical protein